MSSPDDKARHRRRMKRKVKERQRSLIAKDLLTSGKYNPRVVVDKKGRKHDLDRLDHKTIVELINEED